MERRVDVLGDKEYYAKSRKTNGSQPTVTEHLDAVSNLARRFGEEIGAGEQARLAGLLHDFGKYSAAFQEVLLEKRHHVDHATGGAALLWKWWKGDTSGVHQAILEVINGHHDGLINCGALTQGFRATWEGTPLLTVNGGKTPALNGKSDYAQAYEQFHTSHPEERFSVLPWEFDSREENYETMLYTRMLFSCLVDADYSVSAWEDDRDYFQKTVASSLNAAECLARLNAFRNEIRSKSNANRELNQIRDVVFDQCGKRGETECEGLFTLTAPTGTGKTLALLHFALRHALATGKRRIIIVLPFLTLAEQNAATYEKIMPDVLVDHSQNRLPEELREFTSKWNSPFIITTSVKFFEALFSANPSDCRKLHNLAQSVVVFDEAQSLPPELTGSTLRAVKELCKRYHMTMVFSTATQPDFNAIAKLDWKPREILPEHAALYVKLQRVNVDWRLVDRSPLEEIAGQMQGESAVCGIFNLRRHAATVFKRLWEADPESAFLISTDLCPAHRVRVIKTIQERLAQGKTCRVAATQCIEAGVDLDFPVLYRALAPLDAIIQAAGRCNRNGKLDYGRVIVFKPDDKRLYPDDWYQNAAAVVENMQNDRHLDISDPRDIARYYRRLFANHTDNRKLTEAIAARDFGEVDRCYRLIPNVGEKLIVPYSGMMEIFETLGKELRGRGITPVLMKQAAPLTITVFDSDKLERYAEPIMSRENGRAGRDRSGYWLLREQYKEYYTEEGGLQLPTEDKFDWTI